MIYISAQTVNHPRLDAHPVPQPGQQPDMEPDMEPGQNQGVVQNVWLYVQNIFFMAQNMLMAGNEEEIQEIFPYV